MKLEEMLEAILKTMENDASVNVVVSENRHKLEEMQKLEKEGEVLLAEWLPQTPEVPARDMEIMKKIGLLVAREFVNDCNCDNCASRKTQMLWNIQGASWAIGHAHAGLE